MGVSTEPVSGKKKKPSVKQQFIEALVSGDASKLDEKVSLKQKHIGKLLKKLPPENGSHYNSKPDLTASRTRGFGLFLSLFPPGADSDVLTTFPLNKDDVRKQVEAEGRVFKKMAGDHLKENEFSQMDGKAGWSDLEAGSFYAAMGSNYRMFLLPVDEHADRFDKLMQEQNSDPAKLPPFFQLGGLGTITQQKLRNFFANKALALAITKWIYGLVTGAITPTDQGPAKTDRLVNS